MPQTCAAVESYLITQSNRNRPSEANKEIIGAGGHTRPILSIFIHQLFSFPRIRLPDTPDRLSETNNLLSRGPLIRHTSHHSSHSASRQCSIPPNSYNPHSHKHRYRYNPCRRQRRRPPHDFDPGSLPDAQCRDRGHFGGTQPRCRGCHRRLPFRDTACWQARVSRRILCRRRWVPTPVPGSWETSPSRALWRCLGRIWR